MREGVERISEKSNSWKDKILHRHNEPEEPIEEPGFFAKIKNSIGSLFSKEEEIPVKEPTFGERAKDSLHHARDSLTSKFHKGDKEEIRQEEESRSRIQDSYNKAKDTIYSTFHKGGKGEDISKDESNLKDRVQDTLERAKDVIHSRSHHDEEEKHEKDSRFGNIIHHAKDAIHSKIHRKEEIPEEPIKEPSFTERMKNTFNRVISVFHQDEEPEIEEPVKEPSLKERAQESYSQMKESVHSRLHREKKEEIKPEEPVREPGFGERLSDSWRDVKESISSKFSRGDENAHEAIKLPDEVIEKKGWNDRIQESLHLKRRQVEEPESQEKQQPELEQNADSEKHGCGERVREGFERIIDKIGLGKHEEAEKEKELRDKNDRKLNGSEETDDL